MSLSPDELALFDVEPSVTVPVTVEFAPVLPPDAPPNDANAPAPKKRGRPKKVQPIVDVGSTTSEPQVQNIAREDIGAQEPAGWVMVHCSVCKAEMGKRPRGHQIDPSLCPNVEKHSTAGEVIEALSEFKSADTIHDSSVLARLAKALRAAADALEQP